MRIVYLHQYFNTPEMSGSTRSFEMAKRFSAAGHDVEIVTSDRSPGLQKGWRTEELCGFRVHWAANTYDNRFGFARRLLSFTRFSWLAAWKARALNGDVVFATSTPLTIALPAIFAKAGKGIPMVFEVRDLWPDVPIAMGYLRNPLLRVGARVMERCAYRNATRVIALSEGMKEGVVRCGIDPTRIVVAPNACDLGMFFPGCGNRMRFRHRFGLRDTALVLGYAGTFGAVNRVRYLAEVASNLPKDSNVQIICIGAGRDWDQLSLESKSAPDLQGKFFVAPPIPKAEMPDFFAGVDASISVCLPLKALEANSANKVFDSLAAGVPTFVNYGGWQAKMLDDECAGKRLSADPKAAAIELHETISDPIWMGHARRMARVLAEREFDRDVVSARVLQAIEDAFRERSGRSS